MRDDVIKAPQEVLTVVVVLEDRLLPIAASGHVEDAAG
jgi:hypothetical protein